MNDCVGTSTILAFFDKVIKNGNLSHAYCFVGSADAGKREAVEEISARLLNVTREKLTNQPDFYVVEQVFDEKKEKTKKDISIDQIRDLREYLSRRAYLSGWKIALIDEAEKMSLEAANGLLKTLEEPKEKVVLFLLVKDETDLPETVLSRCQVIYFPPPAKSKLYETRKEEFDRFQSLVHKPFFEKIKIVEELFGDKTDHIAARENLQEILDVWLLSVRDAGQTWPRENVLGVEKNIQEAKILLGQNVHPRLLIENVLLAMP